MSTDEHRKQMVAAAAVAMAQRNVAIAKARFGYQPPERPVAALVAPAPAPVTARIDVLVAEAARRRAEREAVEAAETKAAWARAIARANGKRNGAAATGEKPAELTGWAKVIAQMNARGGR